MTEKSLKNIDTTHTKPNTKTTGDKLSEPTPTPASRLKSNVPDNTRPQHIIRLVEHTLWLLALLVVLYTVLSLASFSMSDPAWSRSVPLSNKVNNFGGIFGAYLADIGYYLFGLSFWWWIIAAGIWLYKSFPLKTPDQSYNHKIAATALCILLLCSPILEALSAKTPQADTLPSGAGGIIGSTVAATLSQLLGISGSLMILLVMVLLAISLLIQVSWLEILEKIGAKIEWCWLKLMRKTDMVTHETVPPQIIRSMVRDTKNIIAKPITPIEGTSNNRKVTVTSANLAPPIQTALFDNDGEVAEPPVAGEYTKPPLNLLRLPQGEPIAVNPDKLQQTAECIEAKLAEFGIGVQVVSATSGPVITRFEIEPAQGVKGSQIVNLSKDLARSMSLQAVRVVETIAGKSTMGIELPNDRRQDVMLSEILSSPIFTDAKSKLTVALGKDIAGTPVVGDLAKMPHLLVGGMTGSGKSVGVNAMILSILFKATPEEVRFIMIDPKMLELSIYDGIPHLLCPVVTDMREAGQALNWCVAEMEKRYRLLAHAGVRNIESYNHKIADEAAVGKPLFNPFSLNPDSPELLQQLPLIVVVIDELADLMMTERKSVEQQIARLAQKARAAGIHMIVATQRPSVDVVTGLIKANIPTRMAFTVQSKIDSRTILDQMGADELLKYGDLLFLQPGSSEPTRLQGAFVADDEVHRIVEHIKRQAGTNYMEGLLSGEALLETAGSTGSPNANSDELFDQAAAFVLETRKTSISSLQRQLRVGYNRAANLMQALEDAGIVSAADVGGIRKILIQKDNLNN